MNRAVFLDRDNTIIHNDGDLGDPSQVRLIQGAASAIASLRGLGYKIVVVSNQGGVARGKYTEQDVDAVNSRIAEIIKRVSGASVDRFYYCPFHPEGTVRQYKREHPWRKPQPGMLQQAADDLGLELTQCWMVGDQSRDIAAGRAAGARTILLRDRSGAHPADASGPVGEGEAKVTADFVAASLVEAVRVIAQQRRPEREAGPLPKPTSPAVAKVAPPTPASPPTPPAAAIAAPVFTPAPSPGPDPTPAPVPADADPEPPGSTDYLPDELPFEEVAAAENGAPAVEAVAVTPPVAIAPPPSAPAPPPEPEAEIPAPLPPLAVDPPRSPPPSPRPTDRIASPIRPAPTSPAASVAPAPAPPPAAPASTPLTSDAVRPIVDRDQGAQIEEMLRQILRHLKRREVDAGDFSLIKMGAALVQMLAIFCALIALYYGSESPAAFLWMLGGFFSQLVVITLLILHGQR